MDWVVCDAETGEVKGMGESRSGAILEAALRISFDERDALAGDPPELYIARMIFLGDYVVERIGLRH
jgi:hypothetical protein